MRFTLTATYSWATTTLLKYPSKPLANFVIVLKFSHQKGYLLSAKKKKSNKLKSNRSGLVHSKVKNVRPTITKK